MGQVEEGRKILDWGRCCKTTGLGRGIDRYRVGDGGVSAEDMWGGQGGKLCSGGGGHLGSLGCRVVDTQHDL